MNRIILLLLALFLMLGSVSAQSFGKRKYKLGHHSAKQKYHLQLERTNDSALEDQDNELLVMDESIAGKTIVNSEDPPKTEDTGKLEPLSLISFFSWIIGFCLIPMAIVYPTLIWVGIGMIGAGLVLSIISKIRIFKNPEKFTKTSKIIANVTLSASLFCATLIGLAAIVASWAIA
ncbi:MAG: hypothetical protein JKY54_01000 [Flavobacteriales bacterium]|nr:hypothetical protein [Flavobacteriales bacterium]